MAARDTCSDTGRTGDGSKLLRNEYLVARDFGPTTLAEQDALGGYNKVDLPEGGTPPRQSKAWGSVEAE